MLRSWGKIAIALATIAASATGALAQPPQADDIAGIWFSPEPEGAPGFEVVGFDEGNVFCRATIDVNPDEAAPEARAYYREGTYETTKGVILARNPQGAMGRFAVVRDHDDLKVEEIGPNGQVYYSGTATQSKTYKTCAAFRERFTDPD